MPIGTDFNFQNLPNDARRLKRFHVSQEEFLTILNKNKGWPKRIAVIENPAIIPDDARVHGVYLDHSRQAYCIIVEHSSYKEVFPGSEIPIGGNTINKVVELRVIEGQYAIPMNLNKQSLEEILSCVLEQLEAMQTEDSDVKV